MKAKRPEHEIISDLQDIECSLSPENLAQDGESTRTQINARRGALMLNRKRLVKELGREPTHMELYPNIRIS